VVAGDKMVVQWDTIGDVPLVSVRLKNSMGVETSRGKTVQRLTVEAGEPNKGSVEDVLPLDFMPGKYTVAVSDPANNIRGMTFVSVLRPISVAEVIEPATGMGRSLSQWRAPTWNRGTSHKISWRMNRGKANMLTIAVAIAPNVEGPWRVLRGAAELKFKVPDADVRDEPRRSSRGEGSHEVTAGVEDPSPRARRPSDHRSDASDDGKDEVVWGPSVSESGETSDEPEWFSDERTRGPRTRVLSNSVGSTFAGFMSSAWAGSDSGSTQSSQPSKPKVEASSSSPPVPLPPSLHTPPSLPKNISLPASAALLAGIPLFERPIPLFKRPSPPVVMYACMHADRHDDVYVCVHVCMLTVFMDVCMCACVYVFTYACMHTCMLVCILCVCVCVLVCVSE